MLKKGSQVQWANSHQISTGEIIEIHDRRIEITRNGVQITRMGKPSNRVLLIQQLNAQMVVKLENEVSLLQTQAI
ncbi:MAG: hypothetical protein R2828_31905 [Saprospiraceae bacterium]